MLLLQILFARGPMVDLLVSSNVSRYAEFKLMDRILTYFEDEVKEVSQYSHFRLWCDLREWRFPPLFLWFYELDFCCLFPVAPSATHYLQ